jgi:pimeloyl-ACP methyl ester carboxylesterase
MKRILVAVVCAFAFSSFATIESATEKLVQIKSTFDGTLEPCWFWHPEKAKIERVPLVVALHTWSYGYKAKSAVRPVFEYAVKHGWAYLAPNFRGPNNTYNACGGKAARQDIVDAVEYAKRTIKIDESRIYIIGGSGGGHMALLMAGTHPEIWAGCVAFCPITDLARWHADSMLKHPGRSRNYARMMEKACRGNPRMKFHEYKSRSPLTYLEAAKNAKVPVYIGTGIHDGWKGSVPVGHSIRAFNVLAEKNDVIPEKEISFIEKKRAIPTSLDKGELRDPQYANGRGVLMRRNSANACLVIFDGGHDMNYPAGLDFLSKQCRGKKADWTLPNAASGKSQALTR